MPIKPELLTDPATTRSLLMREMKQEVRNATGKTALFFAAKKFQPPKKGEKLTTLFVVSPDAKKFEALVKPMGIPVATGACDVMKIDGITRVFIRRSSGSLGLEAVATAVGEAIDQPDVVGTSTDPTLAAAAAAAPKAPLAPRQTPDELARAKRAADQEHAEHEQRVRAGTAAPRKTGEEMARESVAKAQQAGTRDRGFELDAKTVQQFAKASLESAEFAKFRDGFNAFANHYNLGSEAMKIPLAIWAGLLQNLIKTGYVKGLIAHVPGDPNQFILAEMNKETGKTIREEMLDRAMKGLTPFIDHAAKYLDRVIAMAKQGANWAFWSGACAKDAAKKEAAGKGGIVLETTIGAWFENMGNIKPLTADTENLALWAAMSALYARKAAEHCEKFSFIGFLGPGATREQSVFNQIEQPTFIEVMDTRAPVKAPAIQWFVVDCKKDKDGWTPTGKPSIAMGTNRSAALDTIRQRYGT